MSDTDPYMAPDAPNVEVAKYPAVDSLDQPVAEKPVKAPVTESETVPEGSIKEVLAWVGDDAVRAETALSSEKTGEKRTTLINKLSALIN